jgi:hypothetical protein
LAARLFPGQGGKVGPPLFVTADALARLQFREHSSEEFGRGALQGGKSMDVAIWGTVGQWVSGVIAGLALGYVLYKDLWKCPKLSISFVPDRDTKPQTNTVGQHGANTSRWLRVQVQNGMGRRVAKNCRAFVIGIHRVVSSGQNEDLLPNDVRQLRWTHDHSSTPQWRDLLPGVNHWFDVAFADEGGNVLEVPAHPPCGQAIPGEYLFRLQVSAEDAHPVEITLRIFWDGDWKSLRGEQATT